LGQRQLLQASIFLFESIFLLAMPGDLQKRKFFHTIKAQKATT